MVKIRIRIRAIVKVNADIRVGVSPLSAELIFPFSSYSAYLIARFAFFSVSIIFSTAKFCGKVPDGQFQTFNSRERNFA